MDAEPTYTLVVEDRHNGVSGVFDYADENAAAQAFLDALAGHDGYVYLRRVYEHGDETMAAANITDLPEPR